MWACHLHDTGVQKLTLDMLCSFLTSPGEGRPQHNITVNIWENVCLSFCLPFYKQCKPFQKFLDQTSCISGHDNLFQINSQIHEKVCPNSLSDTFSSLASCWSRSVWSVDSNTWFGYQTGKIQIKIQKQIQTSWEVTDVKNMKNNHIHIYLKNNHTYISVNSWKIRLLKFSESQF